MKFLGIVAVVLAASLVTTTASADLAPEPVGVQYQWSGSFGTLSVLGAAGKDIQVYDVYGAPVTAGELQTYLECVPALNAGTGMDGTILHVSVGGKWHAIQSTEWEWIN